jgi:demethylmenaquinone methyltransferase/2-methoxy-6-polyprenyl-1,4-benzoquinol methylase
MSDTDRTALVQRFFSGTGSSYDFMVNFATFGIDRRWKKRILALLPENPRRILDLACGTGILTTAIAQRHPDCQVVGVELRDEYLQHAREKVRRLTLRNVELILSRAEDYGSDRPFDCVCSSYLAKYADLPLLTRNTREMLVNGGAVLMHDFIYPPPGALRSIWNVYFTLMQSVGSRVFPAWREIFFGLPELIERTRWPEELQQALHDNGFATIRMETLTMHGSAIITAHKNA